MIHTMDAVLTEILNRLPLTPSMTQKRNPSDAGLSRQPATLWCVQLQVHHSATSFSTQRVINKAFNLEICSLRSFHLIPIHSNTHLVQQALSLPCRPLPQSFFSSALRKSAAWNYACTSVEFQEYETLKSELGDRGHLAG
jgi:hypothetical protein